MTMQSHLAARLGEIVGTDRVASTPEELAAHAADGILPQAIAGPATADQVAEIVRLALAEKLAIQAFGSRSKCEMGMPPERCDIALDMTGLSQVAHYDAGDLTLSVDAGTPLRELADFLSAHGQFLPLAVPCFEHTTAAGAVASGVDSALRQQYGPARDFLIGAEFVDGTGRLCKSGGRVVKNVTGYDLHKLLIGSLGTLGVITRLNFRTFPLPAASGACLATFRDSRDALLFRKAVEGKGLPLADLEILSPGTSEILCAIVERTDANVARLLPGDAWCAYGSYEGNQSVVARITAELTQAAKEAGAPQCSSLEKSVDEQLGGMLREAYEWLRWASRAAVVQRVVLPQVTQSVLADLERMARAAALRSSLLLRAGGVLYVSLFADSDDHAAMVSLGNVARSVAEVVRENRGHCAILHAPLPVKTRVAASRITLPDESLQLSLKQAFDPSNVFAPGRIVGGI
jgi:glycolate oxidase FAD binding subunit